MSFRPSRPRLPRRSLPCGAAKRGCNLDPTACPTFPPRSPAFAVHGREHRSHFASRSRARARRSRPMPNRDALREELLRTDEHFQQLHEEHQALEHQLEALNQKTLHSEDDETETKRIKREKLRLKDEMEQLLRSRDVAQVGA